MPLLRRAALAWLLLALSLGAEVRVITVLHTNDLHGALLPVRQFETSGTPKPPVGGAAWIAAVVAAERDAASREGRDLLLLDAGDIFHGTPEGNDSKGAAVVEFMNAIGYDALAIGNHEYAYGEASLRKIAGNAKFPFLTCNVTRVDPSLPDAPIVDYARASVVLRRRDLRIAIVGFTAPGTPEMSHPEHVKNLDFLPYARQGTFYLRKAKAEADIVIALTHLGSQSDLALARKAPGWDVIIGGHDHRPLPRGLTEGDTLIAQAGCNGEFVGRVDIGWDTEAKKVVSRTARLIDVDRTLKPVAEIEKLIQPHVRAELDAALGATAGFLGRGGECALGSFIADSIRMSCDADAALLNSGGIRNDLPAGPITRRDLYMAAPFEDALVSWTLTGAELRSLLDGAFRDGRLSYPVSGLSFTVDPRRPAGERILGLKIGGQPFDPARSYTLATTGFAASRLEADSVTRKVLQKGDLPRERKTFTPTLQDALLKRFEGGALVSPPEPGRVQFLGKPR